MSLCSELENINISVDYFIFIKEVFNDYLQYIFNYKSITNEYIQKLEIFHEKYSDKLLGNDIDNINNKNINTKHVFSFTSPLVKIIGKQIEYLKIFMEGVDSQIENNNKWIKENEILSNKFQLMFEEARKDLLKKYREIDKLRDLYKLNMSNTEDILVKNFNKKDKNNIMKEQIKNSLTSAKKIEKDYKDLINSTKLFEGTFDSLYSSSLENFKKLSSETSNQLKDSIINFIVLLKDNMKMTSIELDMHIPSLSNLDEKKEMEKIIVNSYSKNNKLIHVKPEKYRLKLFKKRKGEEIGNDNTSFKSPIVNIEDGFGETSLIEDENIINILKTMKEHFELFEDNDLDMEIEEEKHKCLILTKKIFNIEDPKLKNNIPKDEEIEKLNTLLDKHHNRVVFLQILSEPRGSGKFEITQLTFDILSKLLNTIINKVERDNDFHCVENAIIISQTYYVNDNKNKNNKLYLQQKIQNNELFKSKKFWEEFLDFCINKQIIRSVTNDAKNGNILKENRKDTEDKMSNIAFGRIAPYVNNMKDFGLDKESIIQIVFPKMEKYRMNNESIELVKNLIDNI